jgi:hypothetical protein
MSSPVGRRQVLRASVGVAAALAGLGAEGVLGATPAAAAQSSRPELPEVPGMLGDRHENEFWYQFDSASLYERTPEMTAALTEMQVYFRQTLPVGQQIWDLFAAYTLSPDYPANFVDYMTPIASPLRVISTVEAEVFDAFWRRRDPRLVAAFADFGQGILYDPRRSPPVHTMGSVPPVGYHLWHVIMRAMIYLGIDPPRWRFIAPLNGFGWAVQSVAKPDQYAVNPGLPARTVRSLERQWLCRGLDDLDVAFRSFPYPEGVS